MALFDWPYHTPNDEYPTGSSIRFGNGYSAATAPNGPPEIITHLNFPAMFVYQLNAGGPLDKTADPQLNILALEAFYIQHLMHKPFQYQHATRGLVTCRFNKPLIMPKTMKAEPGKVGGKMVGSVAYRTHQVEPFDMDLRLQPNPGD